MASVKTVRSLGFKWLAYEGEEGEIPAGIYLLKLHNRITRTWCLINFISCSCVSFVYFEHVTGGWGNISMVWDM